MKARPPAQKTELRPGIGLCDQCGEPRWPQRYVGYGMMICDDCGRGEKAVSERDRNMSRKTVTHDLKAWPPLFDPLLTGEKRFDLRYGDRDFHAGDILHIREWTKKSGYTGREASFKVTYLLVGFPWLAKGYVCMSLAPLDEKKPRRAERRRKAKRDTSWDLNGWPI